MITSEINPMGENHPLAVATGWYAPRRCWNSSLKSLHFLDEVKLLCTDSRHGLTGQPSEEEKKAVDYVLKRTLMSGIIYGVGVYGNTFFFLNPRLGFPDRH